MSRNLFTAGNGSSVRDAAVRKTLLAAIERVHGGAPAEALRLLESDGGAALKTPIGQNIVGDIFLKQGKFAEALKAFDAAIKLSPSMPEAFCNRGVALHEMGRHEEALAAEDRAIRYRPEYPTAHFNRGNVLTSLRRFGDAVAAYDRAIRGQPAFPEALLNRGMALVEFDKPLEALADFARVLALRKDHVPAYVGRAAAYRDLGEHGQAFGALDAAMALEPDNTEAALMRCSLLVDAKRFDDALAAADAVAARHPENGRIHAARALALWKLKRLEEGLAAANEAVRLAPTDHEAQTARGIILGDMGRLEESLAALDAARRFGASGAAYHHARAVALASLGDPDEAFAAFEQALALDPDNARAHYNRSFLRLSLGDLPGGWADHEWRLKLRESHVEAQGLAPQWQGEDLTGKKLLIHAEQGLGDTIQFIRYLRLLEGRGATITLRVPEPVRRLFAANFPGIDVADAIGHRGGFDYQVSVMSLPTIFGTTLETIPQNVPYLRSDEERVAKWGARLGDGFKVGIVWQGNPKYPSDRYRSIKLAEYAPLAAVPGVRLISLQSFGGADQLKDLPEGMKVETLGEEIVNNPDGFREVAAVMANLDLMIMSDTGPTHLAGALGRPVWVALNDRPDWRWLRERVDSPWYPTMRLFRQKRRGDWAGVFAEIAAALGEAVAARAR